MNTDDQYVPDEMDARGCFLDGAAGAFTREAANDIDRTPEETP